MPAAPGNPCARRLSGRRIVTCIDAACQILPIRKIQRTERFDIDFVKRKGRAIDGETEFVLEIQSLFRFRRGCRFCHFLLSNEALAQPPFPKKVHAFHLRTEAPLTATSCGVALSRIRQRFGEVALRLLEEEQANASSFWASTQ